MIACAWGPGEEEEVLARGRLLFFLFLFFTFIWYPELGFHQLAS